MTEKIGKDQTTIPNSTQISEVLTQFGLAKRDIEIYLYLLQNPESRAGAIADVLSINRVQVYGILDNLHSKGFVKKLNGNVTLFEPLLPSVAMNEQALDRINQAQNFLGEVSDFAPLLDEIYHKHSSDSGRHEYFEVLTNPRLMNLRVQELGHNGREEALFFIKPPYASKLMNPETGYESKPLEPDHKFIKTRSLFQASEKDIPNIKRLIGSITQEEAKLYEHKIIDSVPFKAYIVDREWVMLGAESADEAHPLGTAILFRHRGLAEVLADKFNMLWEKAVDCKEYFKLIQCTEEDK